MLRGLGGRLGSVPGWLGRGLGRGHILLLTFTQRLLGKLSACSAVVSRRESLSWTCCLYSTLPPTVDLDPVTFLTCPGLRLNLKVCSWSFLVPALGWRLEGLRSTS